jgi:hypothetical protein
MRMAMQVRYRVLYVTVELSADDICRRFMQMMFSVTQHDETIQYMRFDRTNAGKFKSFDNRELSDRPSFQDQDIRDFLLDQLEVVADLPSPYIKEFPMRTLTTKELEAHLDILEGTHGYRPDLLIIDDADNMAVNTDNYRIDIGSRYRELRGIAMKRDMAVATATQIKRDTRGPVHTVEDVAEDWSKAQTADVFITHNQTESEKQLGLARLFVAKGRTAADHFTVLISQAYGFGQFLIDSVGYMNSYHQELDAINGEEEDDSR